jgi:hypothetical protein
MNRKASLRMGPKCVHHGFDLTGQEGVVRVE